MTGMAISLGVLGLAFYLPNLVSSMKMITVISVVCYIASFAISLGPIFWLIISEIYPLNIRGRAMSLATVANWGFNAVVASTFLTLTEKLGKAGTFWFYAAVCAAGIAFCRFFVPETKGHSLEEIEKYLRSKKRFSKLGV